MTRLTALYHTLPVMLIGLPIGALNLAWIAVLHVLDVVAPRLSLRAALAYIACNKAVYRFLLADLDPQQWAARKAVMEAGEVQLRAALKEA
jgi:hypothetical protein